MTRGPQVRPGGRAPVHPPRYDQNPLFAELDALRVARGISLPKWAAMSGVDHRLLTRYRSGYQRPTWLNLDRLADSLGMEIALRSRV